MLRACQINKETVKKEIRTSSNKFFLVLRLYSHTATHACVSVKIESLLSITSHRSVVHFVTVLSDVRMYDTVHKKQIAPFMLSKWNCFFFLSIAFLLIAYSHSCEWWKMCALYVVQNHRDIIIKGYKHRRYNDICTYVRTVGYRCRRIERITIV